MGKGIEKLRAQLHEAMDSLDKELCLQISQELDKTIVDYIRGRKEITESKKERQKVDSEGVFS